MTAKTEAGLVADYEEATDVLYLSVGPIEPVESEGVRDGVELDFRLDTAIPCGVTVVGYRQHRWDSRLSELADITAEHLSIPLENILSALAHFAQSSTPRP
jgi:hypothetical protein